MCYMNLNATREWAVAIDSNFYPAWPVIEGAEFSYVGPNISQLWSFNNSQSSKMDWEALSFKRKFNALVCFIWKLPRSLFKKLWNFLSCLAIHVDILTWYICTFAFWQKSLKLRKHFLSWDSCNGNLWQNWPQILRYLIRKQKQVSFTQSRYHIMLFQSSHVAIIAVYTFFEKDSL